MGKRILYFNSSLMSISIEIIVLESTSVSFNFIIEFFAGPDKILLSNMLSFRA